MALDLCRLLPGVAVGGAADEGQTGVQQISRLVKDPAIEQLAVGRLRKRRFAEGLENVRGGLGRAGAGETKDPHSAGSGRGGDGCNEFGHGLALLFDPFEK